MPEFPEPRPRAFGRTPKAQLISRRRAGTFPAAKGEITQQRLSAGVREPGAAGLQRKRSHPRAHRDHKEEIPAAHG